MDLEDRMTLTSAEGIDLDVSLAGIGSRGAALAIDMAITTVILLVVGWSLGTFGDIGAAGYAILAFAIAFGYPILFEGFARGRTPGKMALGLQVVDADASPVTFLAAAIRGMVRPIDMLPGVYLVGVVAVLATGRSQRLGDLAAGTLVIHRPSDRARRKTEDLLRAAGDIRLDPVLSPESVGWDVTGVTPEEVSMARSFLQRRASLDEGRREDLARTIALQLMPRVAGVPLDGGPERFIERVVAAKTSR